MPGHPRLWRGEEDVDARHKAGHDEESNALRPPFSLPML
jgi:hypothetical protein